MKEEEPASLKHPGETMINPGNLQLQPELGGRVPANTRVDGNRGKVGRGALSISLADYKLNAA